MAPRAILQHDKASNGELLLKICGEIFRNRSRRQNLHSGGQNFLVLNNEPETLKKYALDDVRETRALSDRLSMSTFYLTQMLPFNYTTVAKLGSASKIEALLLREYLRQRYSLPKPGTGSQTTGGYAENFLHRSSRPDYSC